MDNLFFAMSLHAEIFTILHIYHGVLKAYYI